MIHLPRFAAFASLGAAALLVSPVVGSAATVKKPTQAKVTAPKVTCGPDRTTTVAAMNNTKYGAFINIYAEASEKSSLLNSLGVGIEVKGVPVFTVNATQGDWLNVNVAARPNGKTGWIKKSEVHTFQHHYAIRIDLTAKAMAVCNAGRLIQSERVAVGTTRNPTPTGECFTEDLIKPKGGPNGAYGAFAFGLSCFSENPELENFGGGDGRIGIHGTNSPGTLGTAVSHGCVRVSNAGITKLAKTVPLGVPVEIRA